MGNDPILTLSQSVVLNLYTMVTIDWYRRKELNLHFLVRSEGYTPLYDSGNLVEVDGIEPTTFSLQS